MAMTSPVTSQYAKDAGRKQAASGALRARPGSRGAGVGSVLSVGTRREEAGDSGGGLGGRRRRGYGPTASRG